MVGMNNNLILIAYRVIMSGFKNFNNNQKLLIIGFLLCFSKNYLFGKKGIEYY